MAMYRKYATLQLLKCAETTFGWFHSSRCLVPLWQGALIYADEFTMDVIHECGGKSLAFPQEVVCGRKKCAGTRFAPTFNLLQCI